jgi:hypothetical protein
MKVVIQESELASSGAMMMGPDGMVYLIPHSGEAATRVPGGLVGEAAVGPAEASADVNPYKAIDDSLAFLPLMASSGRIC